MVKGLDLFREHFREHEGQYMLIGGTACTVLLESAGIEFRVTKDFDVVLSAEAMTSEFCKAFWEFIHKGGYTVRQKSDGKPQLYRFSKPADHNYPHMLELFSRRLNFHIPDDSNLTPIPVDDEAYSLSAILLDDDYYQFICDGAMVLDGLTIVKANHLIPLKIRAFLDLRKRRLDGEKVDKDDVNKHKRDIFRLMVVAENAPVITLPGNMKDDLDQFIAIVREEPVILKDLGITIFTLDNLLENMSTMYQ